MRLFAIRFWVIGSLEPANQSSEAFDELCGLIIIYMADGTREQRLAGMFFGTLLQVESARFQASDYVLTGGVNYGCKHGADVLLPFLCAEGEQRVQYLGVTLQPVLKQVAQDIQGICTACLIAQKLKEQCGDIRPRAVQMQI